MQKKKILVLLGPTATGKTAFACKIADPLQAELISVDSRQVYRGLDIGSGKDLREYLRPDGSRIPCHLIDIADPRDGDYSLADFLLDSEDALNSIVGRGKVPLFVGGTALYLHALLSSYALNGAAPDPLERERLRNLPLPELQSLLRALDPASEVLKKEAANRSRIIRKIELARASKQIGEQASHCKRTEHGDREFLILGVHRDRAEVHAGIEARLDARIEKEGMLAEAENLHGKYGLSWEQLEFFGLEYRQMALHLQGKISRSEMRDTLLVKIRQFAKRQDSWFRKIERDGFDIHWFRPGETENAILLARDFLDGKTIPLPSFRLSETFYGPRQ